MNRLTVSAAYAWSPDGDGDGRSAAVAAVVVVAITDHRSIVLWKTQLTHYLTCLSAASCLPLALLLTPHRF